MATLLKTIVKPLSDLMRYVKNSTIVGNWFSKGVLAMTSYLREVWPDMDARASIEKGYADNTAVYSIINFTAEKFGSIPRYLYDAKKKDKDNYSARITEGPQYDALLDLLTNPNPEMTPAEFYEMIDICYDSCGEAIVWLNRGDVAQKYIKPQLDPMGVEVAPGQFVDRTAFEIKQLPVLEMWVLPPGWVGVVPDPQNIFSPAGYWLDKGGEKLPISKDDIIHWKRPNPVYDPTTLSHLRGLNPLKVGRRTLQENIDATAAMDRMFKNDGSKGALVNENPRWDTMDETQKQQIIDTIDSRVNNHELKGAVSTLGGKWQYLDFVKRSIDEALLEGKKFTWQELCFLLKTPYELFDGKTAFNNKLESQRGWVSNTIWPKCNKLDEKLTKALTLSFGLKGKVVICSDIYQLPEMQKDITALMTALAQTWYMSPNAKLNLLGQEPSKNPLFNEAWVPDGIRPLSEVEKENAFQDQQDNIKLPSGKDKNQNNDPAEEDDPAGY